MKSDELKSLWPCRKEDTATAHIPEFREHICFYSKFTSLSDWWGWFSVFEWCWHQRVHAFGLHVTPPFPPGIWWPEHKLSWRPAVDCPLVGPYILLCFLCPLWDDPNILCNHGSLSCCLQKTKIAFWGVILFLYLKLLIGITVFLHIS